MYSKLLKIAAIVIAVMLLLLFGAVYVVYLNQHKIIEKAKRSVQASLNGNMEIGGFEFNPFGFPPGLTFSVTDILLTDSLYHTHRQPFAKIKRLEVTFGWESLLSMSISVKDMHVQQGEIFIFKRRDSYSNLSLFRGEDHQKKPEQGETRLSDIFRKINKIRLDDVHFVMADSLREKFYGATLERVTGHYNLNSDGWKAALTGPVLVDQLVFNATKGAFLKNSAIHLNAQIGFNEKTRELRILQGTYLQLKDLEKINVSGVISTTGPAGPMNFRFQTNRIRVPVATSILADTLAKKIENIGIDTFVAADVRLDGELGDKNPAVKVVFSTDTFRFETPIGVFRGLKTNGYFTNRIDSLYKPSNANSEIKTGKIAGFFERVPIRGTLKITDLSDPAARVSLMADTDAKGLNSLLDTTRYFATKGNVKLNLHFNGKLKSFYNAETDQLDGTLIGKATTRDLAVAYLPKRVKLSRIESDISLSQNEVILHKLNLYDNQNELFIKGTLSRLFHHLMGSPTPAKAKIEINIPKWKLNWIEVLVGKDTQKKSTSKKFSRLVDDLVDDLEIDASLKAGELTYHNFKARNVVGKFNMTGAQANISPLTLDAFGGRVTLSGKLLSPADGGFSTFNAAGKVSRANVSNILHSFNDFGQNALSAENVKGKIDVDFTFSSQLNPDVSLIPQSMDGHLNLHLTDGQLIDFDPFLKIKKIIFKNRPLENVKIAPIHKHFRLKGQEVRIEKMQIETNVLTLFVEGQYSFGPNTDLSIQLPLKNLKKRDEEYEFQTYDAEGLRSVFLRAVEEEGEVNIKLDSRKKARKRS